MSIHVIKEHVIQACRHLLGPIVRLLIRNGVSFAEFAELGKEVFVDYARRDYGLQGRPTNNARVAMLTGLSRREVTRVRDVLIGSRTAPAAAQSRLSQLLAAWHLDPDFLADDGSPAVLRTDTKAPSINGLLKRYAGDLPHGALLKEMTQLGLVALDEAGYRVCTRSYVRNPADPDIVRQAGQALYDHGCTLAHNLDARSVEPPRFERMATTPRLARRDLAEFHVFVAGEGQRFLEAADAWLAAHAAPTFGEEAETARAGVGVYVIQDDQ